MLLKIVTIAVFTLIVMIRTKYVYVYIYLAVRRSIGPYVCMYVCMYLCIERQREANASFAWGNRHRLLCELSVGIRVGGFLISQDTSRHKPRAKFTIGFRVGGFCISTPNPKLVP